MPSKKYAARRGSVEDGMRMSTACFARAPLRWTSRIGMHFLLTFQEVRLISKTRNQLSVNQQPLQFSLRVQDKLSLLSAGAAEILNGSGEAMCYGHPPVLSAWRALVYAAILQEEVITRILR